MIISEQMVQAAISQAVKDNILPPNGMLTDYVNNWACVRRMLEAAMESDINISEGNNRKIVKLKIV